MSNSTLTVDLEKFRRNLAVLKERTAARLLLVVKANAYGHGIVQISRVAVEEGVRALGVANTDELRALRQAGVETDVLLLGVVDNEDFADVIDLNGHVPVWRADQLAHFDKIAASKQQTGKYQIKIDTGMGRLGLFVEELAAFLAQAKLYKNIQCTGVYSHFQGADLDDLGAAEEQLRLFNQAVAQIKASGLAPEFIHIANSPATLRMPQAHHNLVRLGIIAYGLNPADPMPLPEGIEAIASWSSKLLNIKTLPPGHGVSYGAEYRTTQAQKIGVVPVGYADGFRRKPARVNTVMLRNVEIPVVGRVCMDHIMIDLTRVPDAALGDEVLLIGGGITADTLANRWGTNNYDAVVNIGQRVARRYKG